MGVEVSVNVANMTRHWTYWTLDKDLLETKNRGGFVLPSKKK